MKLFEGMSNVDDGVECVLNDKAMTGFLDLVRSVYGDHAVQVILNQFTRRENGSWVCPCEDAAEAFRLCLTGVG